jgi:hypothetical protein
MKKSIKSLIIFILLMIGINQLNAVIYPCAWIYSREIHWDFLQKCSTNYYRTDNSKKIYIKNISNWEEFFNIDYVWWNWDFKMKLYETKYWNHLFLNMALYNYVSLKDRKKVLENWFLWLYIDWKKILDYSTEDKTGVKKYKWHMDLLNSFNIDYYDNREFEWLTFVWRSKIKLSEKHIKYLNKFLDKLSKLSKSNKTKYKKVINKLDDLSEKFENKKTYKEKYLFEALNYLYSEIKIKQLKENWVVWYVEHIIK